VGAGVHWFDRAPVRLARVCGQSSNLVVQRSLGGAFVGLERPSETAGRKCSRTLANDAEAVGPGPVIKSQVTVPERHYCSVWPCAISWADSAEDGYAGTASVKSDPRNGLVCISWPATFGRGARTGGAPRGMPRQHPRPKPIQSDPATVMPKSCGGQLPLPRVLPQPRPCCCSDQETR
jgi:hypothetical protein